MAKASFSKPSALGAKNNPTDMHPALLILSFCLSAPASCERLSRLSDKDPLRGHHTIVEEALLSLPREAQLELFSLYARYNESVQKKVEDGWYPGLLTGELVEQPDEIRLPARQTELALEKRRQELNVLEAELKKVEGRAAAVPLMEKIEAKKLEVRRARSAAGRTKGLCLDWSDMVWAELIKTAPEHWRVRDERRAAPPFHTSAVICTPQEEPELCLAFDPWENGRADVFEFRTWNQGSPEARIAPEFFLHQLPEPGRR